MLDNKLYYVIPAQSRVTISLLAYCPTSYAYAHRDVSIHIRQSEKAVLALAYQFMVVKDR